MARRWTRNEKQEVMAAMREGATNAELAEEFNRSPRAISHMIRRFPANNGSKRKPGRLPDAYKRATVIRYLEEGVSIVRIAELTGVRWSSVWRMVLQLVKEGIVERVGGRTRNVKYRVTKAWKANDSDINKPVHYLTSTHTTRRRTDEAEATGT